MPRCHRALLALMMLLPAPGCCSLSELWCGPDRSPWVPRRFRTPAEALKTFKEAIRRDNVRMIYESLSEEFKRRSRLPGPLHAALAWEKIKQKTIGVHLLGTAKDSEPRAEPDGRILYTLTVHGHQLSVWLVRQDYVSVRYRDEDDFVVSEGDYVPHLEPGHLSLQPGGVFMIRTTDAMELPEDLDGSRVLAVTAGREWKVDRLASPKEPQ